MNRNTHPDIKVHAAGRYLRLVERDNWEFTSRANASGVAVLVSVTDDGRVLLVEQYRTPVCARVIELPAGLVGDKEDPDESVLVAAGRELEEETGYRARKLSVLMECPSSSGMSDEIITFVLAEGLEQVGEGGGDDTEDITVHAVEIEKVDDWLKQYMDRGFLLDPKIYSALYWLKFPQAAPSREPA